MGGGGGAQSRSIDWGWTAMAVASQHGERGGCPVIILPWRNCEIILYNNFTYTCMQSKKTENNN